MKKYFALLLFGCITSIFSIGQVVKPEDAIQLVGKRVTVCGEIFSGRFIENSKTSPTLLNMGAKYPKQLLTIVIPKHVRQQYGFKPEEVLQNKNICVTGKITKYQNAVQIIIEDKSQLRIL